VSEHPTQTQPPRDPTGAGLTHDLTSPVDPSPCRTGGPAGPVGYELAEEVGRGGMGVVYRARDIKLDRHVAVKLLQDHLPAGSAAARRFLDEARITGQLQHPNIPPVHEVGELPDGRPFLAMKLIKGRTLEEDLQGRPDPSHDRGRFLAVFEQVCQAVAFAHDRKVIHRDLKPSNVMVGAFGEVQVMDWGLAKVLGGELEPAPPTDDGRVTEVRTFRDPGSDTQAGSVLGTPAFMPPEQAGGEVGKIDERADVFGLGAILCVILTGQPPYVGKDGEAVRLMAIRGRLADCFARLDACGADPELVALAKRCLAVERDDRPRDAGAVAEAIAGFRAAAEERARQAELDRATAELKAAEGRKRRRVQRALAAAVVLLLLGGGAAAWWYDGRAHAERDRLARNREAIEALLAQCEVQLQADDAAKAAIALGAAEERLAEGGGEHLRDRFDRCRTDLELLRELDRIDDLWWATAEGVSQKDQAAAAWPGAFDRFGITPGRTAPADAAARLRESVIRDRALAALDFWFLRDRSAELLVLLREADPDPFRDAVRAAVHGHNHDRVRELAASRDALGQPVRFALVLGRLTAVPADRRVQILKVALRSRPSSLGVLMELGGCFAGDRPETAVERIRWYQVATSVRPANAIAHAQLGAALYHRGDHDGALVAFGEAILLDWKLASPHLGIGAVRYDHGDRNGAIAAFREAIRLDPMASHAHYNLGLVLQERGDLVGAIESFKLAQRLDPNDPDKFEQLRTALLMRDGRIAPPPREVKR
jgi:tetratricopeptide (TPR) repeat protein/tRNA A-37 threonylcarbamoyl transferase component Bud32